MSSERLARLSTAMQELVDDGRLAGLARQLREEAGHLALVLGDLVAVGHPAVVLVGIGMGLAEERLRLGGRHRGVGLGPFPRHEPHRHRPHPVPIQWSRPPDCLLGFYIHPSC